MVRIGNDWDEILKPEFEKDYWGSLQNFLQEEYATNTIYPPAEDVFNALRYTSYSDTRVVILGQDPYHEPGQAHGLAFSVPADIQYPPSLKNILKELEGDPWQGFASAGAGEFHTDSDEGVLTPWAKQGVLLLNTVLTVREHEAGSHRGKGWEIFTDAVIEKLAAGDKGIVFILWGAQAARKKDLILDAMKPDVRHLIITAPHPSPLSAHRGFFGGRYFSRTNYYICDQGGKPIDWRI